MVAVVGCPTKRKFRQIACTDYKTAVLIWKVHQNFSTLSRLRIFIGNVCYTFIVLNIYKMLSYRCGNINFFKRNIISLCKFFGIWFGTLCCTETRHCYSVNIFSVNTEHIKSVNANNKRKCTVKTARKSEHNILNSCMSKSGCKSCCLHCYNFLASSAKVIFCRRYKRSLLKFSWELCIGKRHIKINSSDIFIVRAECTHSSALAHKFLNINIRISNACRKALAFAQQRCVLTYYILCRINCVCCAFPKSWIGINVCTAKFAALHSHKRASVFCFADGIIGGWRIANNRCSRFCKSYWRRFRYP